MTLTPEDFLPTICETYDERLLNRRVIIEGNVCGCLLKNMELFDDCSLVIEDFVTKHGRTMFAIVKKLRARGVQKFDEVTFVSLLEESFVKMVDEAYGGYGQIYNLMQAVSASNWDTYLEDLNKSNVLLKLYKKGFNLFNKITLDNGKEVIPFEFFRGLTSTEVFEFYEGNLASMQVKVNNMKLVEEGYIEFDDAWIESLMKKEEMGVSYGEAGIDVNGDEIRTFPFMSNNTLGLLPGTLSAWGAQSGVGKALPNYTLIPTPNGLRKVGDIRPGDYVFGQNGQPTRVLMIHPQNESKEIWKVSFKDGRSVECCKDHLWEYRYGSHRCFDYRVETTEEIYNRCKGRFKLTAGGYKYAIKVNQAVQYPEKNLPTDPYIIGRKAALNREFISEDYLLANQEQRMRLLCGIIGTTTDICEKKKVVTFSTSNTELKNAVVDLCHSLGFVPYVCLKNERGISYKINIKMFDTHLAITNIERTHIKTEMTCFTVEAPDHLFLANDYIVTHNTTYMVTLAMSLISKGEKVVMVTNESRLKELKAIFLSWVVYRILNHPGLSKRRIIAGDYTDEDIAIIRKAQAYWKEHYAKKIKIITLSDADTEFSCQVIKRAILREGASTFIVDTMKMTITEDAGDKSWVSLIKDVRSLTEIAMKYNVIGIITVQLAPSTINRSWLDASCLANCKQIKETLSNLVLMRKVRPAELDPESPYYIRPFRRKKKDDGSGEWYDEPYEADPSRTWVIAFTDKNRRGMDSAMDGTAFLCRTDLDHASFYETARCYPTQKTFINDDRR